MMLQIMIGVMLMSQSIVKPFAAREANIVETSSLLMLLILSSFNLVSSARVSG
jgi:hypothetical protein